MDLSSVVFALESGDLFRELNKQRHCQSLLKATFILSSKPPAKGIISLLQSKETFNHSINKEFRSGFAVYAYHIFQ